MGWYLRLRERTYRKHPHGIAEYAAKAATVMEGQGLASVRQAQVEVAKRMAAAKGLARLIHQKWNKLKDLGRPGNRFECPVTPEESEALQVRIARDRWILAILVLGEGFLNYLSLMVIIGEEDPFMYFVRGVVALVLTIGAFKGFHYALDVWDPNRPEGEASARSRWGAAAIGLVILLSIAGVTLARARDFEGGEGGVGIVGLGFVFFSLVLPALGGLVDLSIGRMLPLHRRLRKWRAALKDLRAFEARMHQDITAINAVFEETLTEASEGAARMFAGLTDFKVAKTSLDAKRGLDIESVEGTPAATREAFVEWCVARTRDRLSQYRRAIAGDLAEIQQLASRDIETRGGEASP